MSKIKGKLVPLKDKVFVSDMNFGEDVTETGIILKSDNGKGEGIKPRWGRVWAVGPEQKDVKVGEWILMEHARWTREFEYENEDGSITKLHMADLNGMMMSADEKPSDVMRGVAAAAGGNFNFNIPGA
jgi:co-chaperonin GroES (HSP10)